MKAVGDTETGPIDRKGSLIDFDMEKPQPTGRDLLVRIAAISVNPVDTKIRVRRAPEGEQLFVEHKAEAMTKRNNHLVGMARETSRGARCPLPLLPDSSSSRSSI